jgi:RNA-directed DNA polymerase
MMHGHEKSESVIVAAKPANKAAHSAVEQSTAEPAAAEPVEPRAETKGNADQQSTCRAQSRVSVSQALERIRKVAKEKKKEKFTALFHHISIDLLEEAFYELKENAAPSVDRLTWRDYEADHRIVDPSVDSHNNWAPAVANYGEADQDSCDAALREIIPRLQSTFDVAPDD